eukprot:10676351-Lingulodinium_polyedra.AAC.1
MSWLLAGGGRPPAAALCVYRPVRRPCKLGNERSWRPPRPGLDPCRPRPGRAHQRGPHPSPPPPTASHP